MICPKPRPLFSPQIRLFLLLVLFTLSASATLFVAAPPNDDACGAIEISVSECANLEGPYTNEDATLSSEDIPDCGNLSTEDVWFRFQYPSTSNDKVVIGVVSNVGAGYLGQPAFAVYEGACTALTDFICVDETIFDPPLLGTRAVLSGKTVGQYYYIRVWDQDSDEPGAFGITVYTDETDPTITAPDDVDVECIGDTIVSNTGEPGDGNINDDCDADEYLTVTYSDVSDNNTCPEIITRTWQVEDLAGNTCSANQIITVDDQTPPTVTVPDDYVLEGCDVTAIVDFAYSTTATTVTLAEYNALTGAAASDNCNIASVTYQDSQTGSCPIEVTRIWRITDDCNNTTTVNQSINIDDTTPPTVTVPDDYILEGCDVTAIVDFAYSTTATTVTLAEYIALTGAAASDNCNIASVTYQDSQTSSCPIVVTRIWRITDDCNNTTTVNQSIDIDDTTPPTVTVPDDYILEGCDVTAIVDFAYSTTATTVTLAEYLALTGAAASDNCNIASVTYQDSQTGSCPIVVTRTWRITDDCSNTTTVNQTINIDDTTPPTVTVPDDYILEGCDVSAIVDFAYSTTETTVTLAAYLALTGAAASDNCNIASVTYQDGQAVAAQ